MRSDMFKVIVERPRRGGSEDHSGWRQAKKFRLGDDLEVDDHFCGRKIGMKNKRIVPNYKQLNENLNPLYRFIEKQVGRRWDDVYSEICEHINVRSTVQQHVRDHVDQHVETATFKGDDGLYYTCGSRYWSGGIHVINSGTLYVEPGTGILRNTVDYGYAKTIYVGPRYNNNYYGDPHPNLKKVISEKLYFEKIGISWFRHELEKIPKYVPKHCFWSCYDRKAAAEKRGDVAIVAEIDEQIREEKQRYARYVQRCRDSVRGYEVVKTQSVSKKDLRKYKLREVRA